MTLATPVPLSQRRLQRDEALELLRNTPLLELGQMAFAAKRDRYGDAVTFVHNRHINPTNLCVYSCRFCDFAAKKGDAHAYSLDEDQILESLVDPGLREVHMVGGLHPSWSFERSLALVRRMREARPDLWIKAFTAVEVAYFARMARHDDADRILDAMMAAGVDQLPGGGAEVLSARIHRDLYPEKIGPQQWLAIHRTAHRLGLSSNATLLFGHLETDEEIVDHLLTLRELQDQTGGFQSFVPLAYQPGSTRLVPRPVAVPRTLRIVAVARLLLDNFPHIKAYWPTLQVETASAALNFGADDLDGTLGKERIMQLAGSSSPAQATRQWMERIARHAGQRLVERDGRFRTVTATSANR
ncbi:MAG: CofH family radical SAM protein [Candidatus Hydrogenedentes bacterium]|nr:CofH family radical SAM protein [Candidatus Hydrogenedentota bacterium]